MRQSRGMSCIFWYHVLTQNFKVSLPHIISVHSEFSSGKIFIIWWILTVLQQDVWTIFFDGISLLTFVNFLVPPTCTIKLLEGCGFVKYAHREMAQAAINSLNGIYTMRVRSLHFPSGALFWVLSQSQWLITPFSVVGVWPAIDCSFCWS